MASVKTDIVNKIFSINIFRGNEDEFWMEDCIASEEEGGEEVRKLRERKEYLSMT